MPFAANTLTFETRQVPHGVTHLTPACNARAPGVAACLRGQARRCWRLICVGSNADYFY